MKKFEYKEAVRGLFDLSIFGNEGWELCAINGHRYFFKREKNVKAGQNQNKIKKGDWVINTQYTLSRNCYRVGSIQKKTLNIIYWNKIWECPWNIKDVKKVEYGTKGYDFVE